MLGGGGLVDVTLMDSVVQDGVLMVGKPGDSSQIVFIIIAVAAGDW